MTAPILRDNIKYIAEMFKRFAFDPRQAQAANTFDKRTRVYFFSIEPYPATSYWYDWGGFFDHFQDSMGIQIFLDIFLQEVDTAEIMMVTENSFWIDTANYIVYMHLPVKAPWQYYRALSALYENTESTFSTAPKNRHNQSDNFYGNVKADVRMRVPTLNNKLNDVVSGVRIYNSLQITVDNSDGKYDGFEVLDYFNTPLQISKVVGDVDTIAEFNKIRFGIVDDIDVSFGQMSITASDRLFTLSTSFCRKFTLAEFGADIDPDLIGSDVPVAWGAVKDVELIEVRDNSPTYIEYVAIDPLWQVSVQNVFDKDGTDIGGGAWSLQTNGRIRVTAAGGAATAHVTGRANNTIPEIVVEALEERENIRFIAGVWDIAEVTAYTAISAQVGFYFDGGDTRSLVEKVLKNDLAFLIQKNDGLLTIRRWGETYESHTLPEWATTKPGAKDFKSASKMFSSTIRVRYDRREKSNRWNLTYIDDSQELALQGQFRRSRTATFETSLLAEATAQDFADRLLERFGAVRETLKIGVGLDTFEINLLDTISYSGIINGRKFTNFTTWIVKECDPGQDTLVMEGVS